MCVSPIAAEPKSKSVLELLSPGQAQGNVRYLQILEHAIQARVPEPIAFYSGSLDPTMYEAKAARKGPPTFQTNSAYLESQAETFRRTYAGIKLDVVIAFAPQALRFALKYRDRMFPGTPIVFAEVGTREFEGQSWPGVTGVTVPVGIGETIDLAIRLHPGTKTVAVISGNDTFWLGVTHSEILRRNLKDIYFLDDPNPAMLAQVRALPPHTVVLFHRPPVEVLHKGLDGGNFFDEVVKLWPTYSPWPSIGLNHGGIGGAYISLEKEFLQTAEIAARVLNGERPDDIPITHYTGLQVEVDWRALQHWHIPESALPPGSVVLFREPTLWERGKKYFLAGLVLIALQALLIFGLLWQRARKRKAESVLRESEKRFRVMADTTPSLVWMCDVQGKITYLNERRIAFTGLDPDAGYGDTWIDYVHPDDRRNVHDVFSEALEGRRAFSHEYRLRRGDNVYRWMFDVATPRFNGDASFAGFIGSAIDVTDQKLARHALEKVSGQLIEAQEKERRRIARDLHDDVCQRLALLSVELDQANRNANESGKARKQRLTEIRQHCAEIAGDVQSLSHELHSSKLDYLGVVSAIRGFCREFSKQHEVNVEFTDRDVPAEVPRDVSLCLFRVTQEALHNAVKYSGVTEYRVELKAVAGEIQLIVSDSGKGFDVDAAKGNRGLGLVSMQERVHLVHGNLHMESEPRKGTKILAIVPLVSEKVSSSEDTGIEEPEEVRGSA
jgi:PAS domain S-box-containing protein